MKDTRGISSIWLIIILVLGIGVLAVASFFLVVRKDTPQAENMPADIVEIGTLEDDLVQTYSQYPGVILALNNREDVIGVLNSWGLYGRAYRYEEYEMTERVLEGVDFYITDSVPENTVPLYDENTYLEFNAGRLAVYYLLESSEVESSEISEKITKNFFGTLYKISNIEASEEEIDEAVNKSYEYIKLDGEQHFLLVKE